MITRHNIMPLLLLPAALALPGAARAQTQPASAQAGTATAATVDGEVITVQDWIRRMERLGFGDFVVTVSPLVAKGGNGGQIALEALINGKVILHYARKVELLPTDADVQADIQRVMQQPAIQQGVKDGSVTEEQIRDDVRLQRAFVNVVTVNQRVTPEEMQAYYARHPELHGRPETWRLSVIRTATKAAADRALARIKGGEAFDKVAGAVSEDPASRTRGGDLGNVVNSPQLPQFVRETVQKLQVGESSGVVPAQVSGQTMYFILRLAGKQPAQPQPLAAIQDQVQRAALLEKVGGGTQRIRELRREAKITITLPGYENLIDRIDRAPDTAGGTASGAATGR